MLSVAYDISIISKMRTVFVYAIELLELPNEIPIAKWSVGDISSLSSKLILSEEGQWIESSAW